MRKERRRREQERARVKTPNQCEDGGNVRVRERKHHVLGINKYRNYPPTQEKIFQRERKYHV